MTRIKGKLKQGMIIVLENESATVSRITDYGVVYLHAVNRPHRLIVMAYTENKENTSLELI